MASHQSVVVLPSQVGLCPSPLHIRKKTRRSAFYRRITRKSTHSRPPAGSVCGPLDDIINEITGDIWSTPFECTSRATLRERESASEALLTWQYPLKAPSTRTVIALPVSRIPSDQPLKIRKNRNSRSSGSGSSTVFLMPSSRKSSRGRHASAETTLAGTPPNQANAPWPAFEEHHTRLSASASRDSNDSSRAQHALQQTQLGERRSRLRLFTNNLPGLRRVGTGDTTGSSGSVKSLSPVISRPFIDENSMKLQSEMDNQSSDAAATDKIPASYERQHEHEETAATSDSDSMPSSLKASIRILPGTKLLSTDEVQELWIGIEVAGVIHNRHVLVDSSVNIVFVIDNSYYVSKDCLTRALNVVDGALNHLGRGDRVALYTTHCTHNAVSGTVPDMMLPLRPFCGDTEELLCELMTNIGVCGTQTLEPPRANPTMSDIVLAVAKSLESKDISQDRTHVVLLTPTTNLLHTISETFPCLYVHQISPAVLPYRHSQELQDEQCDKPCCEKVFVSNWAHYQSASSRIKQVIRDARSEKPIGTITNVHVEIRTKKGCELIEIEGTPDIRRLRLGQVHSFFVLLRVTGAETQELDFESTDPMFVASLSDTLRQELRNARVVGATNAHLLSVQVLHQNSLFPSDCWNYTETQLVVTKDLGRLTSPINPAMELHKRQLFHRFSRLDANADVDCFELENLAITTPNAFEERKQLIQRMTKERRGHRAILEYETTRPKFLTRPGPIDLNATHVWLMKKWDAQKNKRKGVVA